MPEPAEFQNNRSATNNYDFVIASIDELVRTKRVVEVPFGPKVVNPLSVSTNKGKKRLVLDLRYVNNHLERKSKIRGLESIPKLPFQRWLYIQFRS